jgi:hypothetical protein
VLTSSKPDSQSDASKKTDTRLTLCKIRSQSTKGVEIRTGKLLIPGKSADAKMSKTQRRLASPNMLWVISQSNGSAVSGAN